MAAAAVAPVVVVVGVVETTGWLASITVCPPANSRPVVSVSESDVWAGTHSVPVPDSTVVVDVAGVVTVLPPGVVVVVVAPVDVVFPVDVMLPVSDVAVLGVVAVVVEPTVPVAVPVEVVPVVALVGVPPGETAAPHTGVALGFVISTSVTTS